MVAQPVHEPMTLREARAVLTTEMRVGRYSMTHMAARVGFTRTADLDTFLNGNPDNRIRSIAYTYLGEPIDLFREHVSLVTAADKDVPIPASFTPIVRFHSAMGVHIASVNDLTLSSTARSAIGSPDYVTVLADQVGKQLLIVPAEGKAPDHYRLNKTTGRVRARIAVTTITRWGWASGVKYAAHMAYGGLLVTGEAL